MISQDELDERVLALRKKKCCRDEVEVKPQAVPLSLADSVPNPFAQALNIPRVRGAVHQSDIDRIRGDIQLLQNEPLGTGTGSYLAEGRKQLDKLYIAHSFDLPRIVQRYKEHAKKEPQLNLPDPSKLTKPELIDTLVDVFHEDGSYWSTPPGQSV